MRVTPGMFYIRYVDETIEEAIDAHSVGFKSVEDAMEEAKAIGDKTQFAILNDKLEVVLNAVNVFC